MKNLHTFSQFVNEGKMSRPKLQKILKGFKVSTDKETEDDVLDAIKNGEIKNTEEDIKKWLDKNTNQNESVSDAAFNLDKIFGEDDESIMQFQDIEDNGTVEDMIDFINLYGDEEMLSRYGIRNDRDVKKLAKHIMKESVDDFINEAKLPIDKSWRYGGQIIQFFDSIPALEKYRDPSATYDDPHFTIPIKDFKKIVGWTEKEVEEIDLRLEDYEGYIMWSKEDVEVGDGA